ncbi:MAG: hypothetical protein DME33_08405 [Verrucomicrobia bacterium]|nr:MAG: hypothetical protein DME33_08405 [Verrucomicrobiota bacterium]
MFRTKRRKIDCLDFILAGAQKSGTTALHYFLSKHPDITMGDKQEIHFFDNEEIFAAPRALPASASLDNRRRVHADLHLLETGNGTDLEIQSENQIAHHPAKSSRSRLRALEHATLQRPRTPRLSRCGEGRKTPRQRNRAAAIAALLLC